MLDLALLQVQQQETELSVVYPWLLKTLSIPEALTFPQ
jgi:hypothetical protein